MRTLQRTGFLFHCPKGLQPGHDGAKQQQRQKQKSAPEQVETPAWMCLQWSWRAIERYGVGSVHLKGQDNLKILPCSRVLHNLLVQEFLAECRPLSWCRPAQTRSRRPRPTEYSVALRRPFQSVCASATLARQGCGRTAQIRVPVPVGRAFRGTEAGAGVTNVLSMANSPVVSGSSSPFFWSVRKPISNENGPKVMTS